MYQEDKWQMSNTFFIFQTTEHLKGKEPMKNSLGNKICITLTKVRILHIKNK